VRRPAVPLRRRLAGIRSRTSLGAVFVVGLGLVLGSALMVQAQRRALIGDIETAAALRANDLAASLGEGTLPADLLVPQTDESLVQVVDGSGRVIASTTNLDGTTAFSSLMAPANGFSATTVRTVPVGDSEFRVVAIRAETSGSTYTILVGKSLEPAEKSVRNLVLLLAIGIPPMLLLVGAVTWTMTGRTLRPVEAIRAEVETISTKDLHRRVPEPPVGDEIGRLAHTMNTMLARLETATAREQRFVADASHELRSPLAAIRAQLEVDLAHPTQTDWRHSHNEVLEEIGRMQRLVDDLLVLARADHEHFLVGRTVDVDDIVFEECRRARTLTSVTVDSSLVSGAQMVGDAALLSRAIRNVLENAVRHAEHVVRVSLVEDRACVVITIEDDGPGVPPEMHAKIFERFGRSDDARARTEGGAGLGLAIAREIVDAHGGAVWVESASPGARFVMAIPRLGSDALRS
jgi:signal transduction histidine kinase